MVWLIRILHCSDRVTDDILVPGEAAIKPIRPRTAAFSAKNSPLCQSSDMIHESVHRINGNTNSGSAGAINRAYRRQPGRHA
ncbi:MAG: hypothetical protein ACK4KV_10305 [Rhodocyclaceae bacterium]